VAKTQEPSPRPTDPDLLAAVVLHTLVSAGRGGLTLAQIARACERDPTDRDEAREVDVALGVLLEDDLATRERDRDRDLDLYKPTRAAIRAAELSF